ncbi:MAG: DUF4097 family beta strand repeat-containing protein [Acidobacteriota bacterium]
MMKKRNALLVPVALAAFSFACAVPSAKHAAKISRSWPAAGVKSIVLDTVNGTVQFSTGRPDQVAMEAVIQSNDRRTPEQLVRMDVSDGTLHIADRGSRKRFVFPFIHSGLQVRYTFTVPPKTNISVTNVNGKVRVDGIEGTANLRSVNGTINISTAGAEVTARTVNGSVRADFVNTFRGARLSTVNGPITVSLPPDASFDFEVSQVNGSFKSNVPMTIGKTSRGDVSGAVNGGQFPLELSTVNGSVSVQQRPGLAPPATPAIPPAPPVPPLKSDSTR